MNKRILMIVCGAVIVLGAGLVLFMTLGRQSPLSTAFGVRESLSPNAIIVTENAESFSPGVSRIKKGQTVTFKAPDDKMFWPASDPHPIHTDYPGLDPQGPIPPGKTWQFTFDKVGDFKMHDHLAPYLIGEVIVTN